MRHLSASLCPLSTWADLDDEQAELVQELGDRLALGLVVAGMVEVIRQVDHRVGGHLQTSGQREAR